MSRSATMTECGQRAHRLRLFSGDGGQRLLNLRIAFLVSFFFNDTATTEIYTLSLHDALPISVDVTPRYCEADPYQGGMQAVAEAWRNITAVGGRPLAITDNLNFGNPERPEIMGQFVGCLKGISEACRALDFPVVSGNVSLYNETNGRGILPTDRKSVV